CGPLLRVAQHLVGFADLLEALLCVGLLADVRVELARKAAVGPLDLVLRVVAGDAHELVVVLVFHHPSRAVTATPDANFGKRWGFPVPESSRSGGVPANLAIQSAAMNDRDRSLVRKLSSGLLLACALAAPSVLAHGIAGDDQAFLLRATGPHVGAYMYLGAKHMVTGYDHLLFLAGVIFFLYRLKDVALYVTLFAIGHSATLLLGVLGGLHVDAYIVDAIIGLSV